MRILLIYPPISKFERYSSDIGKSGGSQIPLGVYYIASYIQLHGYQVDVIDAESKNLSSHELVDHVQKFRPDVLGISSTTVAFHRAVEVADTIKKQYPNLIIVLGGPHVSSNVEDAMKKNCFDFGVLREGEVTFYHLLETLKKSENCDKISGIAFRKGSRLVVNPPGPSVKDLDTLPFPAFGLISDISIYAPPPTNFKKLPVVNIITSRGCPSQCTFCDQSIFGRKLRKRSAENIASEIELLYRQYGVREIAFVDDNFTLLPQRVKEIFNILNRKNIHLPWTCMSHINTVDYDLLKFMKDKGCWHISFGIESGNIEILRRIKKNISIERVQQVITWCSKLSIKTKGFFIIGHPGETIETINETIHTALKMPLDDVVVTLNTPMPGTLQYAEADKYGKLDATDWSEFNMWRPVFVPQGLDKRTMILKQKEIYRRFYLRPRIIWRYFLSFFSPSGPRRFVSLFLSLPFLFRKTGTIKSDLR